MAVCQNLVPLVNIKIAGKWMFIPLKMVLRGIDPYPHEIHLKSAKPRHGHQRTKRHRRGARLPHEELRLRRKKRWNLEELYGGYPLVMSK